jgi:phospholipid/cholesterol/gamma-HCH transport system ATP-binding protein
MNAHAARDSGEVVLSVQGLSHSFGGHKILDDISLQIRRGEVVGLIGPGGVGKSVLVKICCALLTPDAGEVEVFGHRLSEMKERDLQLLRQRLGLCFQNYALFDFMTVGDNIAFPMRQRGEASADEIEAKVRLRLAEVDLGRAYAQMPSELSGGMKKRVGLARATINDPELVLFDDPTAGLDPVTSSKIFDLVRGAQAQHNATCVVVSHDIDRMQACCDRYLLLHEGRIWWRGDEAAARASDDPIVSEFFAVKHAGLLGGLIGGALGAGA